MLLTKKVKYRNKYISVSELSPNTRKKVWVMCPECKKIREVYWRVLIKSKSHRCHSCTNKFNSKDIEFGKQFGLLTVIDRRQTGKSICECNCGEITEVDNYNLRNNHTNSCGCLKKKVFDNVEHVSGSQHGNWKGGITPENVKIRKSVDYKNWRKKVFERDDYTCQECGQKGYELRAHHIYDFTNNKDLRLDVNNGITLCDKCHKKLHKKYGNRTSGEEIPFLTTIRKINRYYSLT